MNSSLVAEKYGSIPRDAVMGALGSHLDGLTADVAAERLRQFGRNSITSGRGQTRGLRLFLERFRSPLVLILIFAAVVAFVVHDWLDAVIVLAIVFIDAGALADTGRSVAGDQGDPEARGGGRSVCELMSAARRIKGD